MTWIYKRIVDGTLSLSSLERFFEFHKSRSRMKLLSVYHKAYNYYEPCGPPGSASINCGKTVQTI